MVLTSIVELAVVVLSTFVVRLIALIIDEFESTILTGVVMVLASIVEFAVELSTFVVKLIALITDEVELILLITFNNTS